MTIDEAGELFGYTLEDGLARIDQLLSTRTSEEMPHEPDR